MNDTEDSIYYASIGDNFNDTTNEGNH